MELALLCSLPLALHHGPGPEPDLREQAAARIAMRGTVMEAVPDVLIVKGRVLRGLRLKGGSIIDTRTLIAPRARIQALLDPEAPPEADAASLLTCFFTLERTTAPESLAPRAVVVRDVKRPLSGDNLMVLARSGRVPRRDTLAVTFIAPPSDLEPGRVPELLAETLPWLDPARVVPDETREELWPDLPGRDLNLSRVPGTRFPLDNLLPHPSEVIPAWGLHGTGLAIKGLLPRAMDLIRKSKTRMR